MNYTIHPMAEIFPMMSEQEHRDLVQDMKENGWRDDSVIWTTGGRIIDGRNRYRAAKEAGVEPVFREWSGEGSLIKFVISLNLHRRHLSSSQRAVIALAVEKALSEEAAQRRAAGLKQNQTDEGEGADTVVERFPQRGDEGRAAVQAAQMVGTNAHYVTDAKKIEQNAPDLLEKVRAGEMSIPEAKKAAGIGKEKPKVSPSGLIEGHTCVYSRDSKGRTIKVYGQFEDWAEAKQKASVWEKEHTLPFLYLSVGPLWEDKSYSITIHDAAELAEVKGTASAFVPDDDEENDETDGAEEAHAERREDILYYLDNFNGMMEYVQQYPKEVEEAVKGARIGTSAKTWVLRMCAAFTGEVTNEGH